MLQDKSNFIFDKTSNAYIIIEGASHTNVKKALKDWYGMYAEQLPADYELKLYHAGRARHLIYLNEPLRDEVFNYLVNYLKYPFDIDYDVKVTGYAKASSPTIYPANFLGKRIMVYTPKVDREHDVVFCVSENNDFIKISFSKGAASEKGDFAFEEPVIDFENLSSPALITRVKSAETKDKETDWWFFESPYYRVITLAVFFLFVFLLTYIFRDSPKSYLAENEKIYAMVLAWLGLDYGILRSLKVYLSSLVFTIGVYCYAQLLILPGWYLEGYVINIARTPFILLLVLPVLHYGFITIKHREPVFERPFPTWSDGIFFSLRIFVFLAIAMWLM